MKLKSKIAALAAAVMMATSALSMSASAATWVDYTWADACADFTPYTGSFRATTNSVEVNGLKWTYNQINKYKNSSKQYGVEFEFRPVSDPHGIWSEIEKQFSYCTLPDYYFEFQDGDTDDISICFRDLSKIEPGRSYTGFLSLKPNVIKLGICLKLYQGV